MGKKNKKDKNNSESIMIDSGVEAEVRVVKRDLLQTVLVNVLFLAVLIGLYYWNKSVGDPLSEWIGGFINL